LGPATRDLERAAALRHHIEKLIVRVLYALGEPDPEHAARSEIDETELLVS